MSNKVQKRIQVHVREDPFRRRIRCDQRQDLRKLQIGGEVNLRLCLTCLAPRPGLGLGGRIRLSKYAHRDQSKENANAKVK
jgi:hypothetical protein